MLASVLLLATGASANVVSFTVIDADTNGALAAHDPLEDGASLELSLLPPNLAIRANVDSAVGSVTFDLSGQETRSQTESTAPYALHGDTVGDYNAWAPAVGSYGLVARSHSESGGNGTPGTDFGISFTTVGKGSPPDGDGSVMVLGELLRWHRITVALSGPGANETASLNPFTDYRYQVTFSGRSGQVFSVPGYFAGDGIGGSAGAVWHAHLAPDEVGVWTYVVSFRSGAGIAVDLTETTGSALAPFDGGQGQFVIAESAKVAPDFRAAERGLIKNRGHHYLSTSTGAPWIKSGPNIPENFLGYVGFDNTTIGANRHTYTGHESDWQPGNPDWVSGTNPNAGRAIVGALNFIADTGSNSIYFLPMNIGGDGKDTFPTIGPQVKDRFDLSKLHQWELVLRHANQKGIFLHVVLAETESANENYHDGGLLGPERKLFYRMLHARFGYLNGSQWNLGEENDYSDANRRDFAEYLKAIDPYDHPVTNHTHGNQYDTFTAFLGNGDFDLTSFQGNASNTSMFDLMKDWREQSATASVPWMISFDEPQRIDNDVTDDVLGYPAARRAKLWPSLIGGGGGFEWYVQNDGGGHGFDQSIDDFSQMEDALRWTGHALDFLGLLPLHSMSPDRSLVASVDGPNVYALAQVGEVYAIYSADGASGVSLDLTAESLKTTFTVHWFDPRLGGDLQLGAVMTINGGTMTALGTPPSATNDDWALLVRRLLDPTAIFEDGFESGSTESWQ